MGKPYALIGHVRFDKGEAMKMVSLLYFFANTVFHKQIINFPY
jgi:hypothetical protein